METGFEKPAVPRRISKLAVAGVTLSFISFIPVIFALAGTILGIVALYKIALNKKVLKGRGFAITAIIAGLGQIVALSSLIIPLSFPIKLYRAEEYLNRGKYRQALEYYEQLYVSLHKRDNKSLYGDEFMICHDMGKALQLSGQKEKALRAYTLALRAAEKAVGMSYFGIGAIYMELNKFNEALTEFDKAIEFNPYSPDGYQNKAVTFRLMGRFKDSVAACQKTVSLFPDFAKAYCSMGLALERLNDYENAVKAYLEAVRCAPEFKLARERFEFCVLKLDPQLRSVFFQKFLNLQFGEKTSKSKRK